jgi:hypothetical protein
MPFVRGCAPENEDKAEGVMSDLNEAQNPNFYRVRIRDGHNAGGLFISAVGTRCIPSTQFYTTYRSFRIPAIIWDDKERSREIKLTCSRTRNSKCAKCRELQDLRQPTSPGSCPSGAHSRSGLHRFCCRGTVRRETQHPSDGPQSTQIVLSCRGRKSFQPGWEFWVFSLASIFTTKQ